MIKQVVCRTTQHNARRIRKVTAAQPLETACSKARDSHVSVAAVLSVMLHAEQGAAPFSPPVRSLPHRLNRLRRRLFTLRQARLSAAAPVMCVAHNPVITFSPASMDTKHMQQKCEEFLKSIKMPGFIVIGLQTDPENTQVIYSLNEMPLKGAVKALTHTLNDLITKI